MRFKTAMLIGGVWLALNAAPAHAQWFVTPYAGGHFGGDTSNTKFNLGAGVGYLGAGVVGFETDFNYAPNFFDASNNINFETKGSNLATVMFNGIVAARPQTVIRPYASGGIGWMRSRIDEVAGAFAVKNNDLGVNVGAGVIAQFNRNVGWRTDVRYFRAVVDNQEDNDFDAAFGNFNFWRATAGLTFSF
jgi:opacity protein-like surface antigen